MINTYGRNVFTRINTFLQKVFVTINKVIVWKVCLNVMMLIFQEYRWSTSVISCNVLTGIRGFW